MSLLFSRHKRFSLMTKKVTAALLTVFIINSVSLPYALADEASSTAMTTGDAQAQGQVQNVINTDTVQTNAPLASSTAPLANTDASSTSPLVWPNGQLGNATSTNAFNPETLGPSNTNQAPSIQLLNEAKASNTLAIEAQSGDNHASSQNSVDIGTGKSQASADTLNIINTNILNSQGLLLFMNALQPLLGDVDLRNFLPEGTLASSTSSTTSCALVSCQTKFLTSSTSSVASLVNSVVVRSISGLNSASSTDASASITTGDANAVANVVNVVNSNFTNSNYLLVVINNFGDLLGDIVFPGKSFFANFFDKPMSQQTSGAADSLPSSNASSTTPSLVSNSDAHITNAVDTLADSGSNQATNSNGNVAITSGSANAFSNVVNQANTNLFNGRPLVISLRIFGDWLGDVFSVPPDIAWTQTPQGISLFASSTQPFMGKPVSASILNSNSTTDIINNVNVMALTGKNRLDANGQVASIKTGNAYSAANVITIANTNMVGTNWLHAIINIFGKWQGNLVFGRPNLWVGQRVQTTDNLLTSGSSLTYHVTLANRGDSDANDVLLSSSLNAPSLSYQTASRPYRLANSSQLKWDIGTLKAGESLDISYQAAVSDNLPPQDNLTWTARVTSKEPDQDSADNIDTLSLAIVRHALSDGGNSRSSLLPLVPLPPAHLLLSKNLNASSTTALTNKPLDFTLTIKNDSDGPAYHTIATDKLTDSNGVVVSSQSWDLAEVFPHEEITITYSLLFNASSTLGIYTNTARVVGVSGYSDAREGMITQSNDASVSFGLTHPVPKASSLIPPPIVRAPAVLSFLAPQIATAQEITEIPSSSPTIKTHYIRTDIHPVDQSELPQPVILDQAATSTMVLMKHRELPFLASLLDRWINDPRLFIFLALIALILLGIWQQAGFVKKSPSWHIVRHRL